MNDELTVDPAREGGEGTAEVLTRMGACLACEKPIPQTFNIIWGPKYCSTECSERVAAEGRERTAYFKEARAQHNRRMRLQHSGLRADVGAGRLTLERLPDLYAETRIEGGVNVERYREIVTLLTDFVKAPPLLRKAGVAAILFIHGSKGTGKTWLVESAIGYAVLEMNESAIFTSPLQMWADLKDHERGEAQVIADLTGCAVLGIDDLARKTTPTEWEIATLLQVVDERYRKNRPTIVSCNYSVKELFEMWSDADDPRKTKNLELLCDRLADKKAAISIAMSGKSLRRERA
jgi:DNA replication protein DnaC